ncbi:unnamed protein product [Caenorhabditis brenneri]
MRATLLALLFLIVPFFAFAVAYETGTPDPSIYEKTCAKSDKTDVILVVDGKKLHVNKALLSYHSDYFNTLFNSECTEKSMEDIKIEDVDFDDFVTLLSLIGDNSLEINEQNAEKLLELADRFLMRSPKLLVANVVKSLPEFSKHKMLLLADKYDLEDLLQYALSLYTSKGDYKSLSLYHTTPALQNRPTVTDTIIACALRDLQ